MLTRTASTAAALAAVLAVSAPAFAQPLEGQNPEGPFSISVQYGDLDVSHDAGAQTLLRRIQHAADRACGGRPDYRLLAQRKPFEECRSGAIGRAVTDMHNPMLSAAAGISKPALVLASR